MRMPADLVRLLPRWAALALTAGVLAISPSAGAAGNDFTFVLKERAGPYRYWEALLKGQSYDAAIAAFGLPSSRGTEYHSNLCTVRWNGAGIDVGFASRLSPCARVNLARGAWYGMRLWGARWHTLRGLRVGDPASRVKRIYPKATFHTKPPQPPSYWIATWRLEPDTPLSPLLEAEISGGRVAALVVHAGYVY